jgi:hypothetical protein
LLKPWTITTKLGLPAFANAVATSRTAWSESIGCKSGNATFFFDGGVVDIVGRGAFDEVGWHRCPDRLMRSEEIHHGPISLGALRFLKRRPHK